MVGFTRVSFAVKVAHLSLGKLAEWLFIRIKYSG
jgi:hypothetical protein